MIDAAYVPTMVLLLLMLAACVMALIVSYIEDRER